MTKIAGYIFDQIERIAWFGPAADQPDGHVIDLLNAIQRPASGLGQGIENRVKAGPCAAQPA